MGQTKLESLMETLRSTVIGFVLSVLSAIFIIHPLVRHVGDNYELAMGILVTCYYTVLSLVRQYLVRRWHNNKMLEGRGD